MAQEALQAFIAKVESDEEAMSRLNELGTPEETVALAAEWGLEITIEEIKALGGVSEELDESELEAIAGGARVQAAKTGGAPGCSIRAHTKGTSCQATTSTYCGCDAPGSSGSKFTLGG